MWQQREQGDPEHDAGGPTSTSAATPKSFAVGEINRTFVDPHRTTVANGAVAGPDEPHARHDDLLPGRRRARGEARRRTRPPIAPQGRIRSSSSRTGSAAAVRSTRACSSVGSAPGSWSRRRASHSRTTTLRWARRERLPEPARRHELRDHLDAELSASAGPLSGMVDPDKIGAAGHSLGGVTTLGLAANTCCQDARVKAAIVFSGDSETLPARPLRLLAARRRCCSCTATPTRVVPYESSVDAFNLARGPKGLVTVREGRPRIDRRPVDACVPEHRARHHRLLRRVRGREHRRRRPDRRRRRERRDPHRVRRDGGIGGHRPDDRAARAAGAPRVRQRPRPG